VKVDKHTPTLVLLVLCFHKRKKTKKRRKRKKRKKERKEKKARKKKRKEKKKENKKKEVEKENVLCLSKPAYDSLLIGK